MRVCVFGLLLLLPQIAFAGGLRLAADWPELTYGNIRNVSGQRFLLTSVRWDRSRKELPEVPHYQLLDLEQRKMVDLAVPLRDLPQTHQDVLGRKSPKAELVHTNGEVTSFTSNALTPDARPTATYFFQYDHRAQRFSELVKLSPWDDSHLAVEVGFDPTDTHFYFATAVNPKGRVADGFTVLELGRVNLKTREVDWSMTVDIPRRDKALELRPMVFSSDGSKLAMVEYNDSGKERGHPAKPKQQVYVVDIATKRVDTFPIPLTTYGALFTRDSRHLVLGGHESGEILRIDLQKKKVDATAKGIKKLHRFFPTASGKSFIAVSNSLLASPKVIEVRRTTDLKVQTAIPVRMLYPRNDGVQPEMFSGLGGRMLLTTYVSETGFSNNKGVRLYEVPDDVDSPVVEGSAAGDMRAAQAAVVGKKFADAAGIRYSSFVAEPTATFAQFAAAPGGDVIFAGTLSENTDAEWKPGRTQAVVVRLDPNGKARWQKVLTSAGFLEHDGKSVAVTADGGCIALIYSFMRAGMSGVARLVKLDANGNVIWEHQVKGDGSPKTQLADKVALQADGTVLLTGRYYETKDEKSVRGWTALIGSDGKVIKEELASGPVP